MFFGHCRNKETLAIKNDSKGSVYYFYSPASSVRVVDTLFLGIGNFSKPDTLSHKGRIPERSEVELPYFGSWKRLINEEYGGKITFFFFSISTLYNNTWEEIVNKQLYDDKKSYTVEELEKIYQCALSL